MVGNQHAYQLFAGIFVVLVVASVAGFVLDRAYRATTVYPTIKNLNGGSWWRLSPPRLPLAVSA